MPPAKQRDECGEQIVAGPAANIRRRSRRGAASTIGLRLSKGPQRKRAQLEQSKEQPDAVASGEQAETEFVDTSETTNASTPHLSGITGLMPGTAGLTRLKRALDVGGDQRGDEGQKDDQRNHQHGHRTKPERHLTVRSPEPTRSRHPVQKTLPTLGPNHQPFPAPGCVPAVKGPVAFPRAMRMYHPVSRAKTRVQFA